MMFTGTVRFNLDPFSQHSDEELWSVLKLVCLDEYIKSLPDELNSKVAENGSNWSVGERQILSMARALLKKSKIVLMDEATSSMSHAIQDSIESTIRSAFAKCTVVTVAHRLETIMDYDRVLVMDNGRIIEDGVPRELARHSNSHFAALVHATSQY